MRGRVRAPQLSQGVGQSRWDSREAKPVARFRVPQLVALTAIVANSAYAQKVGDCIVVKGDGGPVAVLVNQRSLNGQELTLYLEAIGAIEAAFNQDAPQPDAQAITMMLARLRAMPSTFGEDSRECLRQQVANKVSATCEPGDAVLKNLLRSQDPDLERLSISILLNQDTRQWFNDRELRRYLRAKLDSPAADPDFRISILYLFGYADRFSQVRGAARRLVSDTTDRALSRGAAQVVRWETLRNHGYAALTKLFETSAGILRQEAAIMLLQESSGKMAPDLEAALASEMVVMLYDQGLPPETRGEAIEACEELVEDARIRAALLSMLEEKNWFYGVNGTHAKEHSLIAVISALEPLDRAEVRDALAALQGKLGRLDTRDRAGVERALRTALR